MQTNLVAMERPNLSKEADILWGAWFGDIDRVTNDLKSGQNIDATVNFESSR